MFLEVEGHLLIRHAPGERPHEEDPAQPREHYVGHDAGHHHGGRTEAELLEAEGRHQHGGDGSHGQDDRLRSTIFHRQRTRTPRILPSRVSR